MERERVREEGREEREGVEGEGEENGEGNRKRGRRVVKGRGEGEGRRQGKIVRVWGGGVRALQFTTKLHQHHVTRPAVVLG